MTVSSPGSNGGSVVIRRQLGRRLRYLREHAGKSLADVQAAHLGSRAKISKVESGHLSVRIADVRAWCSFYGADLAMTETLVQLALGTTQENWWEAGSVPDWFALYAGLERIACGVRCFEPMLVAGLVQTPEYARALLSLLNHGDLLDKRVRFRMERQQHTRNVAIVIGEPALRWEVGGPAVMAAQLDHLRSVDAEVRVLPFAAGVPPTVYSFRLLDFDDPSDPAVVYLEAAGLGRYLEAPSEWDAYEAVWSDLLSSSVPIGEWR